MNLFEKIKNQKFLSFSLLTFTLCTGILIGTVLNTGVQAAKEGQVVAPDATPLVVPAAAKLETDFSRLAKQVEPSVVNISTDYMPKQAPAARRNRPPQGQGEEGEMDEDQLDLFRRFFGPNGPQLRGMPAPRRSGTGSGFIVDPNGYIITNHHVVEKADHIKVTFPEDSTEYRAKLIGFDRETDLAVIKIDTGKKLPALKIGNSDGVEVGDWAVAIGSPFGLEATMTVGIVSAKGRSNIGSGAFQSFIQTDAAINPGNSGGPLVNIKGEVIGVNTAIATSTGGSQGVGFALPINTAVKTYNQLIKTGRVTRGSIGIQFGRGDRPELMKALGVSGGVIVEQVTPNGPAEKAGLKEEDIITAINGKPLKDGSDLIARVADTPIGETMKLTVDRGGKKQDFNVVIEDRTKVFADRPEIAGERSGEDVLPSAGENQAKFGIAIANIGPGERERLGLEEKGGVQITRVEPDSFASEIDLRDGDVILSINRQPVASADDVKKIQATLKPGDAVAFRVARPIPEQLRQQARPGRTSNTFFVSGTLPKN